MQYKNELVSSMEYLSTKDNTIFIGQQTVFKGNPMSTTIENVPSHKLLELPVFEETQMGMSLGLAISGLTVITFYPRWDFLICAANQLINHVDKYSLMTNAKVNLIVRVGKGADKPLDPGHQHKGNYLQQFADMCPNITFHDLTSYGMIYNTYKDAYDEGGIHLIVEYPELYHI